MIKLFGLGLVVMLFVPSSAWSKIGGNDVKFRPSGADTVVFSHNIHTARAVKCNECHYKVYSTVGHKGKLTMADMQKNQSCGVCHNGQRTFDVKDRNNCSKCHK
jgi:c(7)-type cytochrome triheme protein